MDKRRLTNSLFSVHQEREGRERQLTSARCLHETPAGHLGLSRRTEQRTDLKCSYPFQFSDEESEQEPEEGRGHTRTRQRDELQVRSVRGAWRDTTGGCRQAGPRAEGPCGPGTAQRRLAPMPSGLLMPAAPVVSSESTCTNLGDCPEIVPLSLQTS